MKKRIFKRTLSIILTSFIITSLNSPVRAIAADVVKLDRAGMLAATTTSYEAGTVIRYASYSQKATDIHDGYIPVEKLDDPIYCSMNLPSETMSDYTKSVWRDNAHVYGDTSNPLCAKAVAIGALYSTCDVTLPEEFKIYFGKIRLYAYSKSLQKWITIDNSAYPAAAYNYTLPWKNSTATPLSPVIKNGYMELTVTASMLNSACIHFWGQKVPIDREDYLYYAAAYNFRTDASAAGKVTACIGIDIKAATGTTPVLQLFSSRGLSSTTAYKTHWGHSVPNDKYDEYNTKDLGEVFIHDYPDSSYVKHETPPEENNNPGQGGNEDPNQGQGGNEDPNQGQGGNEDPNQGQGGNEDPNQGQGGNEDPNQGQGGNEDPNQGQGGNEDPNQGQGGNEDPNQGQGGNEDPNQGQGGNENPVDENDPLLLANATLDKTIPKISVSSIESSKKKAKISWDEPISGAVYYQVEYSTNKKFKKNTERVTVKATKNTSITIKKLKSGKTYFIHVRSYVEKSGKIVYSRWSKKQKIKII